ncbi:TonB-dependent receptor plug domain-containing protein [Solitalea canadensis]|uniref:Outer membrane receptor for ferrienterochelin and colicins n=1 Tax=Solitalea canadensis (strain ATCC 29591 / DSM 3403 / JCM 21819 / LMG 8368 / NBRC 15130 / NCIMB 12057 / USAM 9D) TaxID=929556 RepID=H8KML1_SOLCM|nr:TonB-dependent receptor plug domain-containing protein [Solitalea canadensis]AFD09002.1 outer membrane receptor for ferrienterochelin and colicins [Solitalea canadensis DSM 3403]
MKRTLFSVLSLAGLAILAIAFHVPSDGDPLIKKIAKNLEELYLKTPQEKIYIHFDKPYYAAGDDMFFKAYLVNANDNTPSELSRIIYVDILNGEEHVVKQLLLKKDRGEFNGTVKLTDSLAEGTYRLRAYTSWMRNFGEEYFFTKELKVGNARLTNVFTTVDYEYDKATKNDEVMAVIKFVDEKGMPIKSKNVSYDVIMVGRSGTKGKTETSDNGEIRIPVTNSNNANYTHKRIVTTINYDGLPFVKTFYLPYFSSDVDLQFFPEGGYLVETIPNIVAFKAIDVHGKGVDVEGFITDQDNNNVTDFKSRHLGMGKIALIPEPGKKYTAHFKNRGGVEQTVALPVAKAEGIVLNIRNQTKDRLQGMIIASKALQDAKKEVVVVGQAYGTIYYTGNEKLEEKAYQINIPKDRFPTGIAQITVFTLDGTPLVERLVFINKNDELKFNINSSKPVYTSREKVDLNISVKDAEGNPVQGDFSIAVTDDQSVTIDKHDNNILSHLLLTSDLKGTIEKPAYYFDANETNAPQDLDVLMLTQGWRRFEWGDIVAGKAPETSFPIDLGMEVSGKITSLSDKTPIKNGSIAFFSAKNKEIFQTANTDAKGVFTINGIEFPDSTRFILQARNEKGGKGVDIEVNDPFHPAPLNHLVIPENVNNQIANYIKANRKKFDYDNVKYGGSKGVLLSEVVVRSTKIDPNEPSVMKLYSHADAVITADDIAKSSAISSGNLLDAIRGRVAGVQVIGNDILIRGPNTLFGSTSPLVVLDGTETDVGWLSMLNPNDVQSVEFLKGPSAAIYGSRGANGVVAVYTKRGKFLSGAYYKKGMLSFYPVGYHVAKAFYVPKYEQENKPNIPDFRTTIYWNGLVKTNADGHASVSFFTADNATNYTTIIEGVSTKGKVGHGVHSITVVTKNP